LKACLLLLLLLRQSPQALQLVHHHLLLPLLLLQGRLLPLRLLLAQPALQAVLQKQRRRLPLLLPRLLHLPAHLRHQGPWDPQLLSLCAVLLLLLLLQLPPAALP
jgi:hypothetical protein